MRREHSWGHRVHEVVHGRRVGPVALAILIAGLTLAVAMDGSLPELWSRILFGALIVADIIVVDWLIN
ncbi:MAG: hypothetical protein IT336_03035 [Thermomicrobiales bacterium]|nr:hypothetical protein [Thermomicrobiales bacterium]